MKKNRRQEIVDRLTRKKTGKEQIEKEKLHQTSFVVYRVAKNISDLCLYST